MRILYSRVQFRKDGSSIHYEELANALQKVGVEVFRTSLFFLQRQGVSDTDESQTPSRSKAMSTLKKVPPRLAKELAIPLFNLRYVAREISQAQKIIGHVKPNILFLSADYISLNYFWLSNLVACWKAKQNRLPLVLEVNGPLVYEYQKFIQKPKYLYWDYPLLASTFEKKIWRCADAIICVSNQLKEFLVKAGISPTKISVVPNGADLDKFSLTVKGENVRKRYHLDDKIIVGFVGSLKIWHGVDNLIKSLRIAVAKNNRLHCLIVGNLDDYPDIHNLINAEEMSDYVTLTGNIPYSSIPKHIAAMDITTVPYPNIENFYFSPMKLFEYMAMAKPVIASRIGQIDEVIRHRGNGYLVKPGDLQELAQGILELADNAELREQIGKNARKTVEENYTWIKNAQAIRNIYETLLANRGKYHWEAQEK